MFQYQGHKIVSAGIMPISDFFVLFPRKRTMSKRSNNGILELWFNFMLLDLLY